MRRDAFHAIADPTRREILNLVAGHPLNLNAVAENFGISSPAFPKHIRLLKIYRPRYASGVINSYRYNIIVNVIYKSC